MAPKWIVRDAAVVEDDVLHLGTDDEVPATGDITVPLSRWESVRQTARQGRTGLRLHGADDVRSLEGKLENVTLVALEFPKFADGRNYSNARILRDQLGYRGELRAIGDILNDQLFYLRRCGINAFELHPTLDPAAALRHLADFSVVYQTAADGRPPVYAR